MEPNRNEFWFTPEMLESMKRKIWVACWGYARRSRTGSADEMKEAYEEWSESENKIEVKT